MRGRRCPVLIDADLQDPPEAIPEIPEHWRRGADGLRGGGVRDRGGGDPGRGRTDGAGTLATTIPSAPGHVGTFDWFAAQGLEAYGAPPPRAVAFTLTVHAVLWMTSPVVGLLCLLARGIRPQRVRGGGGVLFPAFEKPPAGPRASATTMIRAGAAGEARCER